MSHIAANSKNSFAVDMGGNLYTWGSHQTGLLGTLTDKDEITPQKVVVRDGYDEYFVETINAGQFHVAVVANRKDKTKKNFPELIKELSFAKQFFFELKAWFTENIRAYSPQEFIRIMLKKQPNTQEIKYNEFEKYFLLPFFATLKLNKKDFYHMNAVYNEYLSELLGFTKNNPVFKFSDLDKLSESKNPKIKDLYKFAVNCSRYFTDNPEDFKYFARLVFKFKALVGFEDIKELFIYSFNSNKVSESELNTVIRKIMNVLVISGDEGEKKIESNVLIDCILEKQTGIHNIFTWGVHSEGRLGYKEIDQTGPEEENTNEDEEIQIQKIPKLVYFRKNIKIKAVACGFFHTLALSDDHEVFAWGTSKFGCLGKYLQENQYTPMMIEQDIEGNKFNNIIQIAAGMYMSLALDEKGRVFTWGLGNNGRLGHGDENSVEKPKIINYFVSRDIKVKQISCGDLHCAAISTSKELFTWGNGNYGKLGHCTFENVSSPTLVSFFSMSKVENVGCGSYNTIAVTTEGKMYAWGKNSHGMLGIPHLKEQNVMIPTEIMYQRDDQDLCVSEVVLGSMHLLYLCTNGSLYSCGNSVDGILGIENVIDKITFPQRVESDANFYKSTNTDILKETDLFKTYSSDFTIQCPFSPLPKAITYVDCSTYNTAFLTNTGELYMSGFRNNLPKAEEDGTENISKHIVDRYVTKITYFREKVNYISLGKQHVICVADGKAYSWGVNNYGVCGISGKSNGEIIAKPTLIETIKTNVKMTCVSDTHSLVLTSNGEIFAFGSNMYGKLGIGDLNRYFNIGATPMEPEPILVKNVTTASYIACSNSHSACIMKFNQESKECYSVYTWGSGFNGKLGHNGVLDVYEPKLVEELENKVNEAQNRTLYFVKLALGDEFSLALDECGKMWGWGKKKYLPGVVGDAEGKTETPVLISDKMTFKFIAAKGNFACAITINGEMYAWGDVIMEESTKKFEFGEVSNEKMDFVAIGFNHFASIDSTYQPYTWGSNLYNKCGYESNVDGNVEVVELPRRIDMFYDLFLQNEELIKLDTQNGETTNPGTREEKNFDSASVKSGAESKKVVDKAKLEGKDPTQLKLLDEPAERKNLGLMVKDLKLNEIFFDTMKNFFKSIQSIEEQKTKLFLSVEDKIMAAINKSECKTNNKYQSDIPLIFAKNFQFYESFVQLVQAHPCYLQKIYENNPNPSNFMKLCGIIYGKNDIFLRNKRVISNLTGVWNSIFSNYRFNPHQNINESILYCLYSLIFRISDENVQIANEIISISLLYLISKMLEREYINIEKNADQLLLKFRTLEIKAKQKIFEGLKETLLGYLEKSFIDLKDNFSYSPFVLWIMSSLIRRFEKDKLKEGEDNENRLNKILNFFIFNPCLEIITAITSTNETNLPAEFFTLWKKVSETLLKSPFGLFSQILNDFKSKKDSINENVFKAICMPKSDLLKEVAEIISELSNSQDPIPNSKESLLVYDYDFTLSTVTETAKILSENGNEQITIPMRIKDITELQSNFDLILKDLDQKDPLRYIINELKEFSDDKLDSTSPTNNIVINIGYNPYSFYLEDPPNAMIKCEKCLMPIPESLLKENSINLCMHGFEWTCRKCHRENESEVIECVKCGEVKQRDQIESKSFFFKRYYIKNTDEMALLFEKVLCILPPLYVQDDLSKVVNTELNKLRESKESNKDLKKIRLLEKFKNKFAHEKEKNNLQEKEMIAQMRKAIEENLQRREIHSAYLSKIEDMLSLIEQISEGAKVNFSAIEKAAASYKSNISKGYVSQYFTSLNRIIPKITKGNKSKKIISKMFLVKDLIDKKVIQQITFDKQEQPQLVQKSYLEFEKTEKGFVMKLSYKENFKKYVVCGTSKHDYKLSEYLISNSHLRYLRRIARHNPVAEFGDISFNSFYLVVLLNSLLTE